MEFCHFASLMRVKWYLIELSLKKILNGNDSPLPSTFHNLLTQSLRLNSLKDCITNCLDV